MAMMGPQIGGISLMMHLMIIVLYRLKKTIMTIMSGIIGLFGKTSHLFRLRAK